MTISTESFTPLFVVVGSTGQQGASVIKAIEASSSPYRVRGLTRDVSKLEATAKDLEERNVEVVAADVGKEAELAKAFEGATYVFAMTTPDVAVSRFCAGFPRVWAELTRRRSAGSATRKEPN